VEVVVSLVIFVVVIVGAAFVLGAFGGPWGRHLGRLVRYGQSATPTGAFPPATDEEFEKPRDESELL
jgi:hypothetical protein